MSVDRGVGLYIVFLMIRRPPVSTPTYTLSPTRRSSDLCSYFEKEREIYDRSTGRIGCFPNARRIGRTHRAADVPARRRGRQGRRGRDQGCRRRGAVNPQQNRTNRSEEHTSELQSLMRISYAVFCLKTQKSTTQTIQ